MADRRRRIPARPIDDLAENLVTFVFAEIKGPAEDRLRSNGADRDADQENFHATLGHAESVAGYRRRGTLRLGGATRVSPLGLAS